MFVLIQAYWPMRFHVKINEFIYFIFSGFGF